MFPGVYVSNTVKTSDFCTNDKCSVFFYRNLESHSPCDCACANCAYRVVKRMATLTGEALVLKCFAFPVH